jgi:hypothetical protein
VSSGVGREVVSSGVGRKVSCGFGREVVSTGVLTGDVMEWCCKRGGVIWFGRGGVKWFKKRWCQVVFGREVVSCGFGIEMVSSSGFGKEVATMNLEERWRHWFWKRGGVIWFWKRGGDIGFGREVAALVLEKRW